MGLVLQDVDRHGWGGDAGHGTHGLVMVARIQLDLARFDQNLGLGFILGLALKDEGSRDGAAHRPRSALPSDGRASVQ